MSQTDMIAREWRARTSEAGASTYRDHFRAAVLPTLREVEGFMAASLLSRRIDGGVELVVITRWQSLECIRGFTGPEIGKAVVEPAIAATLLSYDLAAQHYAVMEEATVPVPDLAPAT